MPPSAPQRLVSVGWARFRPVLADGHAMCEYSNLAERTLRDYRAKFSSIFSLLERSPSREIELHQAFPSEGTANAAAADGWGPMAATRGAAVVAAATPTPSERLQELLQFLERSGVRDAQVEGWQGWEAEGWQGWEVEYGRDGWRRAWHVEDGSHVL